MSSSSIQFRGKDAVLAAYENRKVAAWSVWQGRQFMFKNDGGNEEEAMGQLENVLEALAGSSNAIYTLKVYEELPAGGKIKSTTPDDGSFNFRLNDDNQIITNGQYTHLQNNNDLAQRLATLEAKLEEEPEESEPPNRLGLIGEIISNPTLQPIVSQIIAAVFSKAAAPGQPVAPGQPQLAAVSGINQEATLQEAIQELQKHDSRLAEHLAKLAKIAVDNPPSFTFLLQTLDSM